MHPWLSFVSQAANFAFANYYVLEQFLKAWANGPRRYIHSKANIFDAIITLALVVSWICGGSCPSVVNENTQEVKMNTI